MLQGNAVIGQSGGPTSVINSSLAGVIEGARELQNIENVYGMNFGIEGFMQERLYDLSGQPDEVIAGLRTTPSSALGSSRHKLQDEDFPVVMDVLKKYNIRYFFLIGGNDTMDTVHRIEAHCREQGYDLIGIGIPKTVDNDLFGTDHTPGFASAARSNILNVLQAGVLARDMQKVDQFVIYQTIGREAGWLAAATALARDGEGSAPHLIYCPERKITRKGFLDDVKECLEKNGWVSIVVSEGLLWEDGSPVSASEVSDAFSNTEFGAMGGASVALNLHRLISGELGLRGEFQITESLIMSAFDRAEPDDLEQAYQVGREAARLADSGTSGVMVTIDRQPDQSFVLGTAPLSDVAVRAKAMPDHFINERGNDVTEAFLEYMTPLVSDLPPFTRLKPLFVKEPS